MAEHQADRQPEVMALSVREVARLLGISVRTVWRLVAAGDLPQPVRVGRAARWDRQTLVDWWEAKTSRKAQDGNGSHDT